MKAETLVVFHGNVIHISESNQSGRGRTAYNFVVVDGGLEMPDNSFVKPTGQGEGFVRL